MRLSIATASFALLLVAMPANAGEWCGFRDISHAKVKCGYSSYAQCHAAIGGKHSICIPDPTFARRMGHAGKARMARMRD